MNSKEAKYCTRVHSRIFIESKKNLEKGMGKPPHLQPRSHRPKKTHLMLSLPTKILLYCIFLIKVTASLTKVIDTGNTFLLCYVIIDGCSKLIRNFYLQRVKIVETRTAISRDGKC